MDRALPSRIERFPRFRNRGVRLKISCSALLFDLDGVLIQTQAAIERAWTRWAREHNLDPGSVIHAAHGRPTAETVRELLPSVDADAEARLIEDRERADVDGVFATEGAAQLLASIPAHRWTVVTSAMRQMAESRLRQFGLPMPRAIVTADDIERGKPDPEPYLKGASALGFPAAECIVIEDAPAGIRSAQAAGARVIAIPTTYTRAEIAAADYVVERLSDLRVRVTAEDLEITMKESNQ